LDRPTATLSGGEAQRLKLASFLARPRAERPRLFLFDEPTTGLHFDDVRVLLQVFQRLVTAGHSVLVIEHNLDVIRAADWIIDLGPEAGERGGQLVVAGTPEQVAACAASHTGQALRQAEQRSADAA
jgi:excinuclease ABC subunit A